MKIDNDLMNKIIKQLENEYPDSIHSTPDILPEMKTDEEREQIRKHLLYLRDQNRISLREGLSGRKVKALLFDIKKIPD